MKKILYLIRRNTYLSVSHLIYPKSMKDVCPVSGTTVFTRFSLSLNVGLKNDAD